MTGGAEARGQRVLMSPVDSLEIPMSHVFTFVLVDFVDVKKYSRRIASLSFLLSTNLYV